MELCTHPDCDRKHSCKGYCKIHYERKRLGQAMDSYRTKKCKIDGCSRYNKGRGFCRKHLAQDQKFELRSKFHIITQAAKKKNLARSISFEEYQIVIGDRICFYCKKDFWKEAGTNLDRMDNNQGYVFDNVIACCARCNELKGEDYTAEQFQKISKIINEPIVVSLEQNQIEYEFKSNFYY